MPVPLLPSLIVAPLLATLGAAGTPSAAEEAADPIPERKMVIATVDALGAAVEHRYGLQLEIVFARQNSIALNPWLMDSYSEGTHGLDFYYEGSDPIFHTRTVAMGLDAQYRYYFFDVRRNGSAEGLFLAPGIVVQHFDTNTVATVLPMDMGETELNAPPQPLGDPVHQSWTYVGPSLDIGGQLVLPFGPVVTGSFGVQCRAAQGRFDDSTMPLGWDLSNGPGLRPRWRIGFGWGF